MEFTFVRNHLPGERAINAGQLMGMPTSELMAPDGTYIAEVKSIYTVEGHRCRLVGLWRSLDHECGLAINQSMEKAPAVVISPIVVIRIQGWQTKQIWPSMICQQSTGPFMVKTILQRLEAFDEHDPELAEKIGGAWQELVDRYGCDDGSAQLCRVTSLSYRRGLKQV